MGELFNLLLVHPTINLLLVFLFLFNLLRIPGAFGFAILAITAAIRLIFHPLYKNQMKMAQQMEEIKPELDQLSKKYKNDKQRLQQEQLKLYQTKGLNPASGCLGGIIQIPIFIALYQVLRLFLEGKSVKTVISQVNDAAYFDFVKISTLNPHFFGFDLSVPPSQFQQFGYHYLLIPLVTAGLQYLQITLQQPAKKKNAIKPVKQNEKSNESKPEDFQQMMSKQMRLMFPLMIGYFSYILPAGLALYWNIFSLISIAQVKNPWKNKK